jgi:hypothetical protein
VTLTFGGLTTAHAWRLFTAATEPSKYRKFLKKSPKLTNTNTTFENLLSGKFGRGGACQKAYFSALETKPAM